MSIKLIKLSKEYQKQFFEMMDEWTKFNKENKDANKSPSWIFKNDYHDFDNYLLNLERKDKNNGFVPNSVFFLYDEERDKILGAVDIRHYLNKGLLFDGGHIGDGIRPSERKKGYATLLIKLSLDECKKLNINDCLIVCNKDNIGSKKSIINNGGIFSNEVMSDEGDIEERYWIKIK